VGRDLLAKSARRRKDVGAIRNCLHRAWIAPNPYFG
jgi:hypothetical protein